MVFLWYNTHSKNTKAYFFRTIRVPFSVGVLLPDNLSERLTHLRLATQLGSHLGYLFRENEIDAISLKPKFITVQRNKMLSQALIDYLASQDITPSQMASYAIKYSPEKGLAIYINLKRRGDNVLIIPLNDDFEKKERISKQLLDYFKPLRANYLDGLNALSGL